MSINEQIVRLQNAKNRLKEILVDKKVELSGNEKLDELIENVDNVETGVDTSDATASSSDILLGKTAYVNDKKVTGNIEDYSGTFEGNGEIQINALKKLLDYTKSTANMFAYNSNLNDLTGYIDYSDTENATDMNSMFRECTNLTSIPPLDTSSATSMYYMFFGCKSLPTIPQLNTSNATNMSNMFEGCKKLTIIPQLDISKISNAGNMFYACGSLTSIPQLDTSNVTSMNYMFYSCNKLTKIDITHFNINSTSYSNYWCYNCYSLKALIIRSFGKKFTLNSNAFNGCYHLLGTVNSTYNPNGDKDGYIYVPRDMVDTLKSATNWSTHADQIRALEDYTVDGTTTGELDESKVNA